MSVGSGQDLRESQGGSSVENDMCFARGENGALEFDW